MPEKQKTSNWKGLQTVIAAIAMTMLLALCNIIASFDHRDVKFQMVSIATVPPANPTPKGRILGDVGATSMPSRVVARTGSS